MTTPYNGENRNDQPGHGSRHGPRHGKDAASRGTASKGMASKAMDRALQAIDDCFSAEMMAYRQRANDFYRSVTLMSVGRTPRAEAEVAALIADSLAFYEEVERQFAEEVAKRPAGESTSGRQIALDGVSRVLKGGFIVLKKQFGADLVDLPPQARVQAISRISGELSRMSQGKPRFDFL